MGLSSACGRHKLREFFHERFRRFILRVRNVVFRERADDAIAREHRRALHDGRRRDAVHAHQRREFDRQFAHKMVARRLGNVVGHRTFFRDGGVGGSGEHELAFQPLFFPRLERFIADEVAAGDIDVERERPFVVGNVAGCVGSKQKFRRSRKSNRSRRKRARLDPASCGCSRGR